MLPQDLLDIVMSAAGQPVPWRVATELVAGAQGAQASSDPAFRRVFQHTEALHQRLISLQSRLQFLIAALDHLPLAVMILTGHARVMAENAAATRLTSAKDGLFQVDGTLRVARPQDTQNLRDALALAETSRQRISVQFGRPSGLMPYLGVVTRLDSGPDGPGDSCCMLGVCDPAADPEVDEQVLRGLYGLTRAESHVATLLLRGRTPEEAADELCVSIATVRTHIKRLLLKTDTDRQGRLIGALLASPAYLVTR